MAQALFSPLQVITALAILGAAVSPAGPQAATMPPPAGAQALVDSFGSVVLAWTYPGQNQLNYYIGSNAKKKACYISRSDGAHQLACRFVLLPARQWVGQIAVWVEKDPSAGALLWETAAALSISLAMDSSGVPGPTLCNPYLSRPADQGIPDSGGYLHADFDLPLNNAIPETLWAVFTWPPSDAGLLRVGVDDQQPQGNAKFRVWLSEGASWESWLDSNPMVSLSTLRYSADCDSAGPSLYGFPPSASNLLSPSGFTVSRHDRTGGSSAGDSCLMATIPGDRTCLRDQAVYAGHTYDYCIRAILDSDTSESACVSVDVLPPFACVWNAPTIAQFCSDGPIVLPFTFENHDLSVLAATFQDGWLFGEPSSAGDAKPASSDSIRLHSSVPTINVTPGGTVIFELAPELGGLPEGTYRASSRFSVADTLGRQIHYKIFCPVEISSPVGVEEQGRGSLPSTPSLVIFPNPTGGEIDVEFSPLHVARAISSKRILADNDGTKYTVCAYDILGHEIARTNHVFPGAQTNRFRTRLSIRDKDGNTLPAGVYVIRVNGEGWSECRKIVILH